MKTDRAARTAEYLLATGLLVHLCLVLVGCANRSEWAALDSRAEALCKQAKYEQAAKVAKQALAMAEQAEPNGLAVATSLNRLADIYQVQAG